MGVRGKEGSREKSRQKKSHPPLRLAKLPPRRLTVTPEPMAPILLGDEPDPLAPSWDGREPYALEPVACQRAWGFRKQREPFRSKAVEALIGQLRAKWRDVEPDWALIESVLREKAGCLPSQPAALTSVTPSAPKRGNREIPDDDEIRRGVQLFRDKKAKSHIAAAEAVFEQELAAKRRKETERATCIRRWRGKIGDWIRDGKS
jgi:hypothetical protein